MDQLVYSFEPEEEATPEGHVESQEMRELFNLALDELPKMSPNILDDDRRGRIAKEVAKIHPSKRVRSECK